jgi:hypothetical protein
LPGLRPSIALAELTPPLERSLTEQYEGRATIDANVIADPSKDKRDSAAYDGDMDVARSPREIGLTAAAERRAALAERAP